MNYSLTVCPQDEREAIVAAEVAQSKRLLRFYEFRNELIDLPVVRIPLELPIYRMANFRTRVMQLSEIRRLPRQDSFFKEGEENESAQQQQHSLLWQLAKEHRDSVASIIETLELEGQRLPLLITSYGVVVNGNRRLAAMRELFAQDGERFQGFAYVDCQVLPVSASADELKEVEVRLQMTPETRLPYEWVNECMAIEELYHAGKSFEDIGRLMRMEPSKVGDKLQMLTEVNLYLNDWTRASGEYERVEKAEQIVSDIAKRLQKKEGSKQEIARRIGWILLDRGGRDGSVYQLREVVGSLTEQLLSKITDTYPEAAASQIVDTNESDLEFDLGEAEGQVSDTALLVFLDSSREDESLKDEITSMSRAVVEASKQQKASNAALKAVTEANTKLTEVALDNADRSTYGAILRHLEAIENRVQVLRQILMNLQDAGRNDH